MSWFDATGFANLAKSALKGAQKTIDKALDIKEEEPKVIQSHVDETSNFFATWGLQNEEETNKCDSNPQKQQNSSSIWGSFTGSFFEPPKIIDNNVRKIVKHSKSLQSTANQDEQHCEMVSSTSVPEELVTKDTKPVVTKDESVHTENEGESSAISESININCNISQESNDKNALESEISEQLSLDNIAFTSTKKNIIKSASLDLEQVYYAPTTDNIDDDSTTSSDEKEEEQYHNEMTLESNDTNQTSSSTNVFHKVPNPVSSESDKKSCESVEILGSQSNTDCTTTPESDLNSITNSLSPSLIGIKVNSESVEILPDSLVTSPSSVEVLGDWKSDSSPYLSPIDPKNSESSPVLDVDECVTPCVDCTDLLLQPPSRDHFAETSSSDISPYESPMEEVKTLNTNSYSCSVDSTPSPNVFSQCISLDTNKNSSQITADSSKTSPESVEVIPDAEELDEVSLAEDSYTSASEGTIMTVFEPLQQLDAVKNKIELTDMNVKISTRMHDSCPDDRQTLAKACIENKLNLSLDSLKEKHNLHLTLEPITTQPIRKLDHQLEGVNEKPDVSTFSQLMSNTIEPPDPDNYAQVENVEDTMMIESNTDQYLVSTDSSGEGTLLQSSLDDNATLVCTNDSPKVLETPLTASSYVKTMLADAMVEKGEINDMETHCTEIPRENSPISSESRSDLVKIGSDQASGHTSGDELETTTSSDIEIISSPNGDSSSTQSRQSPAKLQLAKGSDLLTKTLKTRGHSRELSEISIGSDEVNMEIEKLLKRVQEMTEILEARESKLIDVSRINMELHERNANLMKQLENCEKHVEQNQNINQITDEYTQRLSALERKFQQAIRERDQLRKNLDQLKLEAASRLSSQEMSNINAEKDEIIKELREEGEKLSKQQLQHSNIIKKLRVKEKETDATIKSQKEQIEEQNTELERLKRSLHAKEEVERSQIEAVHTLTAKTKKQEKEILTLQEKLDNVVHKMEAYKKSLDAAKVELAETKETLLTMEEELKEAVDNAGESCQLFAQLEDLKLKYRQAEEAHVKREEFLKHENSELLKRLEAAEARSEELSESVSVATKPLLRQLEQLQANLLHKSNSFMKQEKIMSEKNIELQSKVENLMEMDRLLREENINLKSKESQLESKLNLKEKEKAKLQEAYDKLKEEIERSSEQNKQHQDKIKILEQTHSDYVQELKREINALENKLAVEKAATEAERRRNNALLEQQQNTDEESRYSPTLSIGQESVSSANSAWPAFNDSVFDNSSGRFPPMPYESIRAGSSSTSIFENLQAQRVISCPRWLYLERISATRCIARGESQLRVHFKCYNLFGQNIIHSPNFSCVSPILATQISGFFLFISKLISKFYMEQILEALTNQSISDKSEIEQIDNRDELLDKYMIKPLIPNPSKNSVISNNGNEKTKKEELLMRLTYTLKKLNQYERNDKNYDTNVAQLEAEGIFTQKEVLSQNVEEDIKGIIQSVQEYITKLDYQLKDLDNADQQIENSMMKTLKDIDGTFQSLLDDVCYEINKRREELILEAEIHKHESLIPLRACRREVEAQIQNAQNIISMSENIQHPHRYSTNRFEKIIAASNDIGRIPAVPYSEELPNINFDRPLSSYKEEIIEQISKLGCISRTVPVQITNIEERPAGLFVKWHITNPEYTTEEQTFIVEKANGEILDPTSCEFETVYKGSETFCFVRNIPVNQPVTLRVRIQADSVARSVHHIARTSILPYSWELDNKHYMITNNGKTAAKLTDTISTLFSHGPQFDANHIIEFKFLEVSPKGDNDEGIALVYNPRDSHDTLKRTASLMITSCGKIFMDGNEKLMRLPRMCFGTNIMISAFRKNAHILRVNIESENKCVTYDWRVQTPLFFAARFTEYKKWSLMVK